MTDETPQDEKKIFVDEDWKSQVEAEREEIRKKTAQRPEPAAESPAAESAAADATGHAAGHAAGAAEAEANDPALPLPPPTLSVLLGSLYLQGMIALGMLPNPVDNKPAVNLDHARHTIDMLAMLEEKTQGNRTNEESEELERILHELRMTFLTVKQNQPK